MKSAYLSLPVHEVGLPQHGFGDDSPPNHRLNCAGFCHNWPPPSPQSTTTASIPKSQYSPKRMKTEPPNDGTRPLPSSSSFLK